MLVTVYGVTDQTAVTCYRHPDRPTRLSCTTCGKPICVECSHDAAVGQKCPDCAVQDPRARVVTARTLTAGPSWQSTPVSFAIIAITTAVFLLGFLGPEIDLWLLENLALIRPGNTGIEPEIYRIFTVALLHGGVMHIAFNMYALWIFGPRLEMQVGSAAFGSLYLASAGVGGLTSIAFGSAGLSVGASGAIFGLFGAWMFVAWKMRRSPGGRAMFNQLGILMAINIAIPLIQPRVDWLGHLGGFAAGLGIAALWSLFAVGRTNARTIRTMIGIAVMFGAAIATYLVI